MTRRKVKQIERKVEKKLAQKESEKIEMHSRRKRRPVRHPGKKGDAVKASMGQAQEYARRAALAVLDPMSAINRGFVPGKCDGMINQTVKFFTVSKVQVPVFAGGSGTGTAAYAAYLSVAPYPYLQLQQASGFGVNGVPSGTNSQNDSQYAEIIANFSGIRCVAQEVEVRCLDNPLDLAGSRTIVLASHDLYADGYVAAQDRKDVSTYSNNKPGLVVRMVNPEPGDGELQDPTYDWASAGDVDNNIMIVLTAEQSTSTFFLTIVTLYEAIAVGNSLLTPSTTMGDPSTYVAAVSAALQQVPLNSPDRVCYTDGEEIGSAESDLKTILGSLSSAFEQYVGQKSIGLAAAGLGYVSNFVSSRLGSAEISGLSLPYSRRRYGTEAPDAKLNEVSLREIANLYIAANGTGDPLSNIAAFREILSGRSDAQVWEFLLTEMGQPHEPIARVQTKPPRERDEWTMAPVPQRLAAQKR